MPFLDPCINTKISWRDVKGIWEIAANFKFRQSCDSDRKTLKALWKTVCHQTEWDLDHQFRHWDKKILKKILNTMVKTKDNLKVKNVSKVKGEGTEEQKSR